MFTRQSYKLVDYAISLPWSPCIKAETFHHPGARVRHVGHGVYHTSLPRGYGIIWECDTWKQECCVRTNSASFPIAINPTISLREAAYAFFKLDCLYDWSRAGSYSMTLAAVSTTLTEIHRLSIHNMFTDRQPKPLNLQKLMEDDVTRPSTAIAEVDENKNIKTIDIKPFYKGIWVRLSSNGDLHLSYHTSGPMAPTEYDKMACWDLLLDKINDINPTENLPKVALYEDYLYLMGPLPRPIIDIILHFAISRCEKSDCDGWAWNGDCCSLDCAFAVH